MASVVENLVKTRLPTPYGEFALYLYNQNGKEHLALVKSAVAGQSGVPVRVHSECITGDLFSSRRCDCGDQLRHALAFLGRSACGVLIYLRQEGRGIGLYKKLQAYNLQDQGLDTVEANVSLGHQPDEREYAVAALILRDLAVDSIRLITNNPRKVEELVRLGIPVESRIPIEVGQHEDNLDYLRSKVEKMAHWITFREAVPSLDTFSFLAPLLDSLSLLRASTEAQPHVTLHHTQTLNGRILSPAEAVAQSMQAAGLLHYLGQHHDAVLVDLASLRSGDMPGLGKGTGVAEFDRVIIVDDGSVSVEDWDDDVPEFSAPPIVLTTGGRNFCASRISWLTGARILASDQDETGISPHRIVTLARSLGIRTLLVIGTAPLIEAFQNSQCVNYCVITINPSISHAPELGRMTADSTRTTGFTLRECRYHPLDTATVVCGTVGQP